jgi:carboxymethylenebutenolidase
MGKIVELKAADGHQFDAYVAEPVGTPKGLIIVAPEIFGVNSHIRNVADGYAANGYLAISPAFFDRAQRKYETGYEPADIAAGVEIMKKMDLANCMLDVTAAMEFGKSAGKVGIVGYCWGGVIAWVAAQRLSGIACSAPYYGGAMPSFVTDALLCPVMMHFAEQDHSITLAQAQAIAAAYPEAEAFYYPAGHGFNCDQRGSYDAQSAKLALSRTLAFFKKYVG